MNDEAVYRTAPATPGLLNIIINNRFYGAVSKNNDVFIPFLKIFFLKKNISCQDRGRRNLYLNLSFLGVQINVYSSDEK